MDMKDFKEVVKLKIIPATFVFRCALCGLEMTNYDKHSGLIKMNEHVISNHPTEVNSLDKEALYSRKPSIVLDRF
ncbi:hypothetical protein ACFLU4_07680 [Chloroflexota bacterium]